ncbi:MAG: glutaminase [Muribaculaceae bacterium]|nr:glutaminase [Muribaculaceae bacterium]
MDRIIPLSDVRKAVDSAYESLKSAKMGEPDSRVSAPDAKAFGITLTLADGTSVSKGDTKAKFPVAEVVKVPVSTILLSQNSKEELIKKSGSCPCQSHKAGKPEIPFSAHGIRAISAIEPAGDPDSKWNFIENRMIDMMGSAPELDVKLYENLKQQALDASVEDVLTSKGYYLYDDAALSIDLYLRALSMTADTEQLAMMGATIAADGVNPVSKKIVFDGSIAPSVVAMMASRAPKKMRKVWLLCSGIPAKAGFGGGVVAVLPGVFSIAVYSPEIAENGLPMKALKAVAEIMNKLQVSVFGSARVAIDTTK